MNKAELMKRIQELSFAKLEAELFLDTHPECKQALDYHRKMIGELDPLMAEYQNRFGPIVKEGVSSDKWNWIDGPWPWQHERDEKGGNK